MGNQPFMSSVERTVVILNHRAKVEAGDSDHILLAARIKVAQDQRDEEEARHARKSHGRAKNNFHGALGVAAEKQKRREMKLNYFWNYNTVERVLLSCLVVVCVCGVMFE